MLVSSTVMTLQFSYTSENFGFIFLQLIDYGHDLTFRGLKHFFFLYLECLSDMKLVISTHTISYFCKSFLVWYILAVSADLERLVEFKFQFCLLSTLSISSLIKCQLESSMYSNSNQFCIIILYSFETSSAVVRVSLCLALHTVVRELLQLKASHPLTAMFHVQKHGNFVHQLPIISHWSGRDQWKLEVWSVFPQQGCKARADHLIKIVSIRMERAEIHNE